VVLKVGAVRARQRLSSLLDRASRGDRIVITRRGVPVAVLVAAPRPAGASTANVIREIKALRKRTKARPGSVRSLRLHGRRY